MNLMFTPQVVSFGPMALNTTSALISSKCISLASPLIQTANTRAYLMSLLKYLISPSNKATPKTTPDLNLQICFPPNLLPTLFHSAYLSKMYHLSSSCSRQKTWSHPLLLFPSHSISDPLINSNYSTF